MKVFLILSCCVAFALADHAINHIDDDHDSDVFIDDDDEDLPPIEGPAAFRSAAYGQPPPALGPYSPVAAGPGSFGPRPGEFGPALGRPVAFSPRPGAFAPGEFGPRPVVFRPRPGAFAGAPGAFVGVPGAFSGPRPVFAAPAPHFIEDAENLGPRPGFFGGPAGPRPLAGIVGHRPAFVSGNPTLAVAHPSPVAPVAPIPPVAPAHPIAPITPVAPVHVAPQPAYGPGPHHVEPNYGPPADYQYGYNVDIGDNYGGAQYSHNENHNGQLTSGKYDVSLPGGSFQSVSYSSHH